MFLNIKKLKNAFWVSSLAFLMLFSSQSVYSKIVSEAFYSNYCPYEYDEPFLYQGNITADIELLVWKASEDGLSFADSADFIENVGDATPKQNLFIDSRSFNPSFQWNTGLRMSVGYRFPCQKWGMGAQWTHFNTTAKNTVKKNFGTDFTVSRPQPGIEALHGTILLPLWSAFGPFVGNLNDSAMVPELAKSHLALHINLLDFDISRECPLCSCFQITPFIGCRLASINQKYDVRYSANISEDLNNVLNSYSETNKMHNKFSGAGVRAGLAVDYDLGCGFSIFASGAVSTLWGQFKIKQVDRLSITAAENVLEVDGGGDIIHNKLKVSDRFHSCRAIMDGLVGLQWKRCCQNGYTITFRISYENHLFFGQNMLQRYPQFAGDGVSREAPYDFTELANQKTQLYRATSIRGDLCLQGITITGRCEF